MCVCVFGKSQMKISSLFPLCNYWSFPRVLTLLPPQHPQPSFFYALLIAAVPWQAPKPGTFCNDYVTNCWAFIRVGHLLPGLLVVFSVWLCHGTKGGCFCAACQIWLTCSHLSLKPTPAQWQGCIGPLVWAPSTKHIYIFFFFFSAILSICVDAPRAEALRWAGHAADKMFHNFGNLLETNCTVQV